MKTVVTFIHLHVAFVDKVCLRLLYKLHQKLGAMLFRFEVRPEGFEPTTSSLSRKRSKPTELRSQFTVVKPSIVLKYNFN